MRRASKIALVVVLALVGLAAAAAGTGALLADSYIRRSLESGMSYWLKVPATLESARLRVLRGSLELRGLTIANPGGFATGRALHVGEIHVEVRPSTLRDDVVEVPEIVIRSPEITVEGSLGGSNLARLVKNLDATLAERQRAGMEPPPGGKREPRYRVARIRITDARLNVSATFLGGREASVTTAHIELTDLPSELTLGEVIQRSLGAVIRENAARPGKLGELMAGIIAGTGLRLVAGVGDVLTGGARTVGQIGQGVAKGVGDTAEGVGKGVGQAVGGVAKGTGEAVKGAGEGVGEGAGKGAEGVGRGVGEVLKGVGQGIGAIGTGIGKGVGEVIKGLGRGVGAVGKGVGEVIKGDGDKDKEKEKEKKENKEKEPGKTDQKSDPAPEKKAEVQP
jgi:hypothetical protein